MSRGIWKGNISFGLVTIPISVVSAQAKKESLDFDLIDKRDKAHVGYQKINKKTGEEVEPENIVKGLKLDSGKYAIFESDELKRLRIKGTNTVDIQQFVTRDEIDPIYFKKTYYLEPDKGGNKTYVLLRETLVKTGKLAIGLIVLHGRQQLVAIAANERVLMMHVMHFDQEIKTFNDLDLPASGMKSTKISPKEISMAERLVDDLTDKWKPKNFKDTYIQQVKKALKSKSRKKVSVDESTEERDTAADDTMAKVLDLMPLLEKSLRKKTRSIPKRKSATRTRRRSS
ncbi:MAG TPA: Ku protein [Bdellovibrionota bacterium]|jgi:DNA end-binding protein Ku|nr:Ku protein [Bdellovibrionota bacterium]